MSGQMQRCLGDPKCCLTQMVCVVLVIANGKQKRLAGC